MLYLTSNNEYDQESYLSEPEKGSKNKTEHTKNTHNGSNSKQQNYRPKTEAAEATGELKHTTPVKPWPKTPSRNHQAHMEVPNPTHAMHQHRETTNTMMEHRKMSQVSLFVICCMCKYRGSHLHEDVHVTACCIQYIMYCLPWHVRFGGK